MLGLPLLRADPASPVIPNRFATTGKVKKWLHHIKRREEDGWVCLEHGIKLHMLPNWFDKQVRSNMMPFRVPS